MNGRPNLVLAVVVALVGVVAVLAVVLSATRDPTEYDPGSPEAAVQGYLSAVVDRDHAAAAERFAAGSSCDVADLDRAFVPDDVRVVLVEADVDGDSARVVVDVVQSPGDVFGGSEFSEQQTFRLGRSDGDWRIEGEPWPVFECDAVG